MSAHLTTLKHALETINQMAPKRRNDGRNGCCPSFWYCNVSRVREGTSILPSDGWPTRVTSCWGPTDDECVQDFKGDHESPWSSIFTLFKNLRKLHRLLGCQFRGITSRVGSCLYRFVSIGCRLAVVHVLPPSGETSTRIIPRPPPL